MYVQEEERGRYSVDDIKIYLVREQEVTQEGYEQMGDNRRGERQQEVAEVQLQAEWRGRDV